MSEVQKIAVWMPVTIEAFIDAGGWDDLSPEQQAAYLRRQAAADARWAAYRRSWRYYRDNLRSGWLSLRRTIGYRIAGYVPDERGDW